MDFIKILQQKADANGDGKITKEDLEQVKDTLSKHNDTLQKLKDKADANGDGKVDLGEAKKSLNDISNLKDKLFGKK